MRNPLISAVLILGLFVPVGAGHAQTAKYDHGHLQRPHDVQRYEALWGLSRARWRAILGNRCGSWVGPTCAVGEQPAGAYRDRSGLGQHGEHGLPLPRHSVLR